MIRITERTHLEFVTMRWQRVWLPLMWNVGNVGNVRNVGDMGNIRNIGKKGNEGTEGIGD